MPFLVYLIHYKKYRIKLDDINFKNKTGLKIEIESKSIKSEQKKNNCEDEIYFSLE